MTPYINYDMPTPLFLNYNCNMTIPMYIACLDYMIHLLYEWYKYECFCERERELRERMTEEEYIAFREQLRADRKKMREKFKHK